jgi:hypothetical protein
LQADFGQQERDQCKAGRVRGWSRENGPLWQRERAVWPAMNNCGSAIPNGSPRAIGWRSVIEATAADRAKDAKPSQIEESAVGRL